MEKTSISMNEIKSISQRNDLLKLFAMLTMLIDHIGYMFFTETQMLRFIGRLAFPIFAYQLAVGYRKTSSLKNYSKRLLIFALITQIPYSFFSPKMEFTPFHLNIMFTLLLALGIIYVYDKGVKYTCSFKNQKNYKQLLLAIVSFIGVCAMVIVPEILGIIFNQFRLEYGMYGLLMVLLFHINHDKKICMIVSYAILSVFEAYILGAEILAKNSMNWFGVSFNTWECLFKFDIVWENITKWKDGLVRLDGYFFQARSIIAFIPIYLIKPIKKFKLNKYVGYTFYPAHITILLVIALII
ncbi:TraX family protein [Abyssisolibacter fermentans]|uniref:TraX family protein n=1 Tax=Abyssisolibacter fermentans TaxID=1766203 RepID=UPI00082B9180|nr:TraX family protein [Abyssisolibacter fermentans]